MYDMSHCWNRTWLGSIPPVFTQWPVPFLGYRRFGWWHLPAAFGTQDEREKASLWWVQERLTKPGQKDRASSHCYQQQYHTARLNLHLVLLCVQLWKLVKQGCVCFPKCLGRSQLTWRYSNFIYTPMAAEYMPVCGKLVQKGIAAWN